MRHESFRQAEVKLELQDIWNANTLVREDVMKTPENHQKSPLKNEVDKSSLWIIAEISDSPHILKIKSDWQLEIQLDGGALMLSANGIFDLNINLFGTEERICSTVKPFSTETYQHELRPENAWKDFPLKLIDGNAPEPGRPWSVFYVYLTTPCLDIPPHHLYYAWTWPLDVDQQHVIWMPFFPPKAAFRLDFRKQ